MANNHHRVSGLKTAKQCFAAFKPKRTNRAGNNNTGGAPYPGLFGK